MTSSLCFVASTAGYAVFSAFYYAFLITNLSRFACGTILVETILRAAGRIYLLPGKAALPITFHLFRRSRSSDVVYIEGHSTLLARYVVVSSATLLHPVFFIVMGFRKNFPSVLVAYVISAFARSLLSGAYMSDYYSCS